MKISFENPVSSWSNNNSDYKQEYENQASKLISELPYDILFTIFSTLSIRDLCMVEKVCTKFSEISKKVWSAKQELTLSRIFVFGETRFACEVDEIFDYEMFESILFRMNAKNLKHLDFSDYKTNLESHANECLDVISKNCPNLNNVSFSGILKNQDFKIYEASFHFFTQNCFKLREIELTFCTINDSSMCILFQNCPHLSSLNISFCTAITGICFESMTQLLEKFFLEDCSLLKDECIFLALSKIKNSVKHLSMNNKIVSNNVLYFVMNNLSKLEILELEVYGFESLISTNLKCINEFNLLRSMHTLDLSYSMGDDRIFAFILCYCCSLKNLILNNCGNVSDLTFTSLKINAPLEKLNLFSVAISNLSLSALEQVASTLKWLKVMGCIELTNEGIANALINLPGLVYYDVRFTAIDNLVVDKALSLTLDHPIYILCQGSCVNVDNADYPFEQKVYEHFFRNFVILRYGLLTIEADTDKEIDVS